MKKLMKWMIVFLVLAVGLMAPIQWMNNREAQKRMTQMTSLHERGKIVDSLSLELERYRRLSGSFRRLENKDIAAAKSKLRDTVTDGVAALEKLEPTEGERKQHADISDRLSEMMILAAKLEPQLFTRDVYQKPEIKKMHDDLLHELSTLRQSADARAKALQPSFTQASSRSMEIVLGVTGVVVVLLVTMMLMQYFAYTRPLSRLIGKVRQIQGRKLPTSAEATLRGVYGEIEQVMNQLALSVGNQQLERHQFLTAIASDLRSPLVALQAEANFLVSEHSSPDQKTQAVQAVKRSVARISQLLDDLSDLVEADRNDIQLNEGIVDLHELLQRTAETIGTQGTSCAIEVSSPKTPVSALADAPRLQRVMTSLLSKLVKYLPTGSRVGISMSRAVQETFRGVEIYIHELAHGGPGKAQTTGPQQDILKHWVSENGFTMMLAHKVIKAHGGTLTASGVAGAGVQFRIRIPEERLASGGLLGSSFGLTSLGRLKSSLPQQA